MFSMVLTIAFAVFALVALVFGLNVRKFLAVRVRPDVATRVVAPAEIADYDVLRAEGDVLFDLGFHYLGALRSAVQALSPEDEFETPVQIEV